MSKEITKIVRQYPETDDCKFQTLGELHKWQIGEITELIKQAKDECLQNKLNNYDVDSLEYKIIKSWMK